MTIVYADGHVQFAALSASQDLTQAMTELELGDSRHMLRWFIEWNRPQ